MMARRVPFFRLLGFEIGVDPSWIFLACLVTWALAMGLFPFHYPGLAAGTYWAMGALGALGLIASVLLHDLATAIVARRHGFVLQGITLSLWGGLSEVKDEPRSPKLEFRLALAGPLGSLLLAGTIFLLLTAAHGLGLPQPVIGVLGFLCAMNLVLALFNLLPAFPLNGGRLLRAGLWEWKKDFVKATRLASQTGEGFGWALMIAGGYSFLQGNIVAGIWWFLIGQFLRVSAKAAFQQIFSTPNDVAPHYEESHRHAA